MDYGGKRVLSVWARSILTLALMHGYGPGSREAEAVAIVGSGDPNAPRAWTDRDWKDMRSVQPLIPYSKDRAITPRTAYCVLNRVSDWSTGHTTVFVGRKKNSRPDGMPYASEEFLSDLKGHVEKTLAALNGQGLLGYIVYATEELEFAVMHWESEDSMNKAFQSEAGQSAAADAGRLFEPKPMVWEKMEKFAGDLETETLESYMKRVGQ